MMEEDLKKKIASRAYTKGIFTRLLSFVSSDLTKVPLDNLITKRERLNSIFSDYEACCKEILYLSPSDTEKPEIIEDYYFKILTALNQEIKIRENEAQAPVKVESHSHNNRIKLPPISIKVFDGKFTEFVPFINMFTSMIHKDASLDLVQKLYYLRSFLKDEPFNLIKNLPITGESYNHAIQLLRNRYENKVRIVNEHIGNLLDLTTMTRSTAGNLRDFVSIIRQEISAIKVHEPRIEHWDSILLCILSRKLDSYTARAYQLDRDEQAEPSLDDFLKYLEKRALALENAEKPPVQQKYQEKGNKIAGHVTTAGAPCIYCKLTTHKLFQCKKFQLLPANERVNFINRTKLCQICLGAHTGKCRFHFKCAECKGPHNTLVHCNPPATAPPVTLAGNTVNNVLLPTARVKIFGRDGTEYHIKALLDSGSQISLVTAEVVKILGLTPKQNNTNIIGIANAKSNAKYCIPLEIYSLKSPFKAKINCHVVDEITCKLPQVKIDLTKVTIPSHLTLADEQFNVPSDIHMLIGADIFFQTLLPSEHPTSLVLPEPRAPPRQAPGQPASTCHSTQPDSPQLHIINTQFGHIVSGGIPSSFSPPTCNKVVLKCELGLNETLAQFWSLEKVPEVFSEKTSEQELCEQIFQSTVKLENNQFQVALPLKLPLSEVNDAIGESFHLALKRFLNLEKRLHANSTLFMQYQQFIHEYLALNHGHYVDIESYELNKEAVYFLPHHAVLNEASKTTSLRTVFDGSMRGQNKISLNDLQLNGPVVQRDLFDILLLFRFGKFTFTTDIRRMFRNIKIDPQYTSLQNILWRDNPSEPIKCIRLDTVTYGLKSSSYLATRCLDELATRFAGSYPAASKIIKNNSYVDDIIYADNNLNTILTAKDQLRKLLALGSFHTHKWSSNDERVLSDIAMAEQHFDSLDLQKENYNMKALGLQINIKNDHFIVSSPEPYDSKKVTKRNILSYVGKFYDPMGFVSPIVVKAKAIMQKLWLLNIGWDHSPPANIQQEWLQFTTDLAAMKPILLGRNIGFSDFDTVELVGFADASSTTAYGCCIYLRVTEASGKVNVHLLCSKSRINPIKKKDMTVPRLELNAALLLSKLMTKTFDVLNLKFNVKNVYLFSDSQIVLAWLKTEPARLQAYIANRVCVIQKTTASWFWVYVESHLNPADLISKGSKPSELAQCTLWWSGPAFLQSREYEFNACRIPSVASAAAAAAALPEAGPCLALSSSMISNDDYPLDYIFKRLLNSSDVQKMVRLLAYILRFINNINKTNEKLNTNFLSAAELKHSLLMIIKYEQSKYFKAEIDALKKGKSVKGNLLNLHPFLDKEGLLRVSGRLHFANIKYDQKHPVILPKSSHITSLLIRSEHERLLHAGPRLVLSNLNQRFWIVNGLLEVKKITHKCITCFRQKATVAKQLMGSLPAGRVLASSRPFEKIGVDFAGPIEVKLSRIRRSIVGKGYICIFVCFTTKAVHLELASDLTTDTFLACFRRLISRRGLPIEVHCDNASTFKCARSRLVELYSLQASQSHQARVHEFASQRGVKFHFIPSYSPTFGGLWEASVNSVKQLLKKTLQKALLTYEQFNTVLTEIEAVLNSRPLLPLSSDPNDYCYLTPGHFIIGTALTMYPQENVSEVPQNRLKFWELCTNLKQLFWKAWHKYYLNNLQCRPKWLTDKCNLKIGSLVILKEDNIPCMLWPMARIVKVFPGHDGKIRAVEVRKPNNKTHVRGIHKICILPIEDN